MCRLWNHLMLSFRETAHAQAKYQDKSRAPCQIVVSNDFPRDFGPWVAFVSEVQIPVSRQGGGREMSAPRPYVTDPFHPLSSIHITNNFHLYRTVSWLFPTCDTFKCVLVRCTIGLLQLAITWYKIGHAGGQAHYYSRYGTLKQRDLNQ